MTLPEVTLTEGELTLRVKLKRKPEDGIWIALGWITDGGGGTVDVAGQHGKTPAEAMLRLGNVSELWAKQERCPEDELPLWQALGIAAPLAAATVGIPSDTPKLGA